MSTRIDPTLAVDLKQFGKADWNECFHCGNCTATCPLSETGFLFPRKGIRNIQMGLKDKIALSTEPWLCYYCGDCSDSCPRDANPGELMMTLRRYLTSLYDWTGLSRKFYTSKSWEFSALAFIFVLVVALFVFFLPPSQNLLNGNDQLFINDQGGVMINSLVDGIGSMEFVQLIEYGDWTMAILVASLLISNIIRMWYKVILKDKSIKISFFAYIKEFWRLIWNFLTQPKFSKCDRKIYWVGHLFLMTGYTIMFAVVVVFLKWFQTEEVFDWWHPQRLLGYYATFGLLAFLIYAFIGRLKQTDQKFKYSHGSDWLFIVMLFFTTLTGILVHIFRVTGMPLETYYMYVVHLAILVPMIVVEVPFSKWSHLAYRPFAIYFANLKKTALAKQSS
ncbi:4Fe-4S dicluster domain-containing protein [Bacteroidota bacterium]